MKKSLRTISAGLLALGCMINGNSHAQVLGTGTYHSFFMCTNNVVDAWGTNTLGQLGTGATGTYDSVAIQIAAIPNLVAITGGYGFSIALKGDGTVWTWGTNFNGSLGNGTNIDSYTAVQASNLSGITAISAGDQHGLALKNDGTVWGWGRNWEGQLGDGTAVSQFNPVQLGLSGIVAISCGHNFSLALKNDGTVWAWGENLEGQMGDNTTTQRNSPVQVTGLSGVTAISAGFAHGLALKNDSTVWAWGDNSYGQLGINSNTDSYVPVMTYALDHITLIDAGDYQSYGLKNDSLWGWGGNNVGQLGNGASTGWELIPVPSGIGNIAQLSSGDGHLLILKNDGSLWGTGYNLYAQLAQNDLVNRNSPVLINGLCMNTLGVAEQNDLSAVSISPNPFSASVTFSFAAEQTNISVTITDVLGKEIKQLKFTGTTLVLEKENMPAGIYFVKFVDAQNRMRTEKIIAQ